MTPASEEGSFDVADGPLFPTYPQIHTDTLEGAVGNMFWMTRTTGNPMALGTAFLREL